MKTKRTRDSFEKRTQMGKDKKKWIKANFKNLQKEIKQSSLQDHADWVQQGAVEMEKTNNVADTHKLHELVKELSGKC